MSATLNLDNIFSKLKEVDEKDQFTLLERLVALIRKNESTNTSVKLSKISGIGLNVWKKTNIDEYIEQERHW